MKTTTQLIYTAVFAAILALPSLARAQEAKVGDNPQPAPAPAISVLELENDAQFKPTDEAEWQKLAVGQQLPVGSTVRTGRKTVAKLQVGPNSVVTLRGISTLSIGDLSVDQDAGAIRTMLAKKYGTMEAEVTQVGDLRNDFTVSAPGQVMAVEGTHWVHVGFGANTQTWGKTGRVLVNGKHGVGKGDVSGVKKPNPGKNAKNNTNQTNTSMPAADGENVTGSDPNAGYGGLNGGATKNVGDRVDSVNAGWDSFRSMIPRDKGNGGGGRF